MNIAIFCGRLADDPEVRYTPTGKAVTTFRLVIDRDGQGQDYIPVVTWERLAETCGNRLTKGQTVAVTGRISYQRYTDQNGQRRTSCEVVASNVEFGGITDNYVNPF